jgi:hypothetical protein
VKRITTQTVAGDGLRGGHGGGQEEARPERQVRAGNTPGGRCAAGNTQRRASVPEAVCVPRAGTCPHGGAVAIAQHRFLVCRALRTLRSGVTPHQPTQITLGRQLQGSGKRASMLGAGARVRPCASCVGWGE